MSASSLESEGCVKGATLTIDSTHDESDLSSVGGACEVSINLFGFGLIERHESVEDVITSSGIIGAT